MTPEQHQELRNRFNPEGSALRRQQMRMLKILDAVDACCRKHNIPYWLCYGTLLGAARHKGFIPWDDDLDIMMLRKDYLRLIKILPSELPEDFVLQTTDTDPCYFFPYAKIRDLKSHVEEFGRYDRLFAYNGIFIDIFPIERTSAFWVKFGKQFQRIIYRLLTKKKAKDDTLRRIIPVIGRFNQKFVFPILRFFAKWCPGKAHRVSFGTSFFLPHYPDEIFPLSEMEFEGKKYPVPRDTENYLKRGFGDWRKVPDPNSIAIHVARLEFC